ncbi:MAG: NifU family protein [Candidatus Nanoarchaeia archaeon]
MVKKSQKSSQKFSEKEVKVAIDELKPVLQADGGDISLVKVENNVVYVKFEGFCATCPFAKITLENFVKKALKEKIPSIKEVRAI